MSNVVSISQNGRIAGTWKHCDGVCDVEFTFLVAHAQLSVSVVDASDGEIPEIYDVHWNEEQLEIGFAAIWSSGRLVKCRASVGPNKDRLQETITSTWQGMWERQ